MVQCKKRKINYKLKKVIDSPKKDWIIVRDTHDAIIEKDLFFKAQELLKAKEKTRNKSVDYLLRGLVYCKECGKKLGSTTDTHSRKSTKSTDTTEMHGVTANTNTANKTDNSSSSSDSEENYRTRYLRCSSYATAPLQRICTPHLINYEKLESTVISKVKAACKKYLEKQKLSSSQSFKNKETDQASELKKEKAILLKSIEILESQIDKIYDDKLSGLISNQDFFRIYDKKISERDMKKQKLNELENTENFRSNLEIEKSICKILESTDITTSDLTSIIHKIEVNEDKKISINFKFSFPNFMS